MSFYRGQRLMYETIYAQSETATATAILAAGTTLISGELLSFGYRVHDPTNTMPFTSLGDGPATNTSGQTQITITGLTAGDSYDVQAVFAGDTTKNYAGSSAVTEYTVSLDKSSIANVITPSTITTATTVMVESTLTDTTINAAIQNEELTVTLDGTTVGNPTTDASGQVTFSLGPNLAVGNHTLVVAFAGDAEVGASSATSTFTVSSTTTTPPPSSSNTALIIGGVVATGVGLFALLRLV